MTRKSSYAAENACICERKLLGAVWVKCKEKECPSPWWHATCAGLKGIKEEALKAVAYTCSSCIWNKVGRQKKESKEDLVQIKDQIVSELKVCLPVLIKNQLDSCQVEKAKEEKVPAIRHSLVLKPNDSNKEYSPKKGRAFFK